MDYVKLGNSDLRVSRICLGCMGFGDPTIGQHSWTIGEGAVKSFDVRLTADDIRYLEEPYVPHNLSVDCDCDGNPASPKMKDVGILASRDPVALDKACLDLVFNHQSVAGDDASPLIKRIESLHGTHTVAYAEQLGLGSQQYTLVNLDEQTGIKSTDSKSSNLYNVYSPDGKKLLTNAKFY